MKINELMEIVHKAYPDEFTRNYWDEKKKQPDPHGSGDTLAKFIVMEIYETFDPRAKRAAQLKEAARVMRRAQTDVYFVVQALEMAQ